MTPVLSLHFTYIHTKKHITKNATDGYENSLRLFFSSLVKM